MNVCLSIKVLERLRPVLSDDRCFMPPDAAGLHRHRRRINACQECSTHFLPRVSDVCILQREALRLSLYIIRYKNRQEECVKMSFC